MTDYNYLSTNYNSSEFPLFLQKNLSLSKFNRRRRFFNPIRKNRCEIKLVADYEFFRVIGNNNYANAARYLVCYFI